MPKAITKQQVSRSAGNSETTTAQQNKRLSRILTAVGGATVATAGAIGLSIVLRRRKERPRGIWGKLSLRGRQMKGPGQTRIPLDRVAKFPAALQDMALSLSPTSREGKARWGKWRNQLTQVGGRARDAAATVSRSPVAVAGRAKEPLGQLVDHAQDMLNQQLSLAKEQGKKAQRTTRNQFGRLVSMLGSKQQQMQKVGATQYRKSQGYVQGLTRQSAEPLRKTHRRVVELGGQVQSKTAELGGQVQSKAAEFGGQVQSKVTELGGQVQNKTAKVTGSVQDALKSTGKSTRRTARKTRRWLRNFVLGLAAGAAWSYFKSANRPRKAP